MADVDDTYGEVRHPPPPKFDKERKNTKKDVKQPFQTRLARSAESNFPAKIFQFKIQRAQPAVSLSDRVAMEIGLVFSGYCHKCHKDTAGKLSGDQKFSSDDVHSPLEHSGTYRTGSSVQYTHSSGLSLFWESDSKQPYLPLKRTHSSPDVCADTLSSPSLWPAEQPAQSNTRY